MPALGKGGLDSGQTTSQLLARENKATCAGPVTTAEVTMEQQQHACMGTEPHTACNRESSTGMLCFDPLVGGLGKNLAEGQSHSTRHLP